MNIENYIKYYFVKDKSKLHFNHEFLINCYDWELDEFQKIVKAFYDTTDCIIHNFKTM